MKKDYDNKPLASFILPTEALKHGDLYRELDRAGDFVLVGDWADLLDDPTEDAGRAIYQQIGCGKDAYRITKGYVK